MRCLSKALEKKDTKQTEWWKSKSLTRDVFKLGLGEHFLDSFNRLSSASTVEAHGTYLEFSDEKTCVSTPAGPH